MDRKNGEIMSSYSFNNAIASAYEHMIQPCLIFHIHCMGKCKLILHRLSLGLHTDAQVQCSELAVWDNYVVKNWRLTSPTTLKRTIYDIKSSLVKRCGKSPG